MVTQSTKQCPKCGRDLDAGAVFCPYDGTSLPPPHSGSYDFEDPHVGRILGGRYKIIARIGRGGMGTVYQAVHVDLNRPVAVKILNTELVTDPVAMSRFRREAKALGSIVHPNAVNVTDFGVTEDGLAYIVMELLEGETLRSIVRNEAPLPLARTVPLVQQICAAVAEAHKKGIIHRDLKPDNILVVNAGRNGEYAKVLDFGIAKLRSPTGHTSHLTARDTTVGTPRYMSPEACEGKDFTPSSDIYGLGIIVYEMLTAHAPFEKGGAIDVAIAQVNDPPPPPTIYNPDIPPDVEAVILRALGKEPETRQPTAIDLADEFATAAKGAIRFAHELGLPMAQGAPPARQTEAFGSRKTLPESYDSESEIPLDQGYDDYADEEQAVVEEPAQTFPILKAVGIGLLVAGALLGIALVVLAYWFFTRHEEPPPAPTANANDSKPIELPPPAPTGMIFVPSGSFTMGENAEPGAPSDNDGMNRPAHVVFAEAFFMDTSEVTNGEYSKFIVATGHPAPTGWDRTDRTPSWQQLPVTNVSWYDASAFSQWAGKRLPTEPEWEKAARGTDARLYPWGNDWDSSRAVSGGSSSSGPRVVGSIASGKSPYEINDMSGNVYEWTGTDFAPYPGGPTTYDRSRVTKVIRGGSYDSEPSWLRVTYRTWVTPSYKSPNLGFRCARSIAK